MIARVMVFGVAALAGSAVADSAFITFDSLPRGTTLDEPKVVQNVRMEWRADPAAAVPFWAQLPYNDFRFGVDNFLLNGETSPGSAIRFTPEGGGFIQTFRYNIASFINQVPDLSYSVDLYGEGGGLLRTLVADTDVFAFLPNGLPIVSYGSDFYDFTTLGLSERVVAVDLRIELGDVEGVRWVLDNVGMSWDPIPTPGGAMMLALAGVLGARRRR